MHKFPGIIGDLEPLHSKSLPTIQKRLMKRREPSSINLLQVYKEEFPVIVQTTHLPKQGIGERMSEYYFTIW